MRKITTVIVGIMVTFLIFGIASAATLYGIILQENGRPLVNSNIVVNGKEIRTNAFGGYRVDLPEGMQELSVTIKGASYMLDPVRIYSPETKQNWRIDPGSMRLIKIR